MKAFSDLVSHLIHDNSPHSYTYYILMYWMYTISVT